MLENERKKSKIGKRQNSQTQKQVDQKKKDKKKKKLTNEQKEQLQLQHKLQRKQRGKVKAHDERNKLDEDFLTGEDWW